MCRTWRSFAVGLKNEWDFNDQFSDKYCTFGNYKDLKCLNQRTTKEGSKVIMSFWGLRLTFFVWECTCSRNIHTHSLFSIFEKKHPEDKNNVLVHTLVWHSEEKYEINWPWTVFLAEVCFKVSMKQSHFKPESLSWYGCTLTGIKHTTCLMPALSSARWTTASSSVHFQNPLITFQGHRVAGVHSNYCRVKVGYTLPGHQFAALPHNYRPRVNLERPLTVNEDWTEWSLTLQTESIWWLQEAKIQ